MKCFHLQSIFLVLFHTQTVLSCVRLYQLCCSDYIPNQLPENTRFDDPDILYTEPEITASTDCKKATADCTLLGFDSGYYNLVFSDKDDNVSKVIEATNPVFELDCGTGESNYISCEHGCTSEKCPSTGNCSTCDPFSLLQPRSGDKNFVPSIFSSNLVDGCTQTILGCTGIDVAGCTYEMFGVKDGAESEPLLITSSPFLGTVLGLLICDGNGKYGYYGQTINSIYCTYKDCR